jgi:site-specific DNA-methyltransferase (adenine-specific)
MSILLGDCLGPAGMPSIAADGVQHIICDPPYSKHVHAKQWIGHALTAEGAARCATNHTEIGFDALTDEVRDAVAMECARIATRWTLIFCDIEGVSAWCASVRAAGLDYVRTCIWDKVDSAPQFTGDRPANAAECIVCAHRPGKKRWNGGGRRNVYTVPVNGGTGAKPHPTQKPLRLMRALIHDFTDPGELICDPFAGSGSTLCAAVGLGRLAIGWERDPKHYETARRRLNGEDAKPAPGQLDLLGNAS